MQQSPLYHSHAHPAPGDQNHTHTNGTHSDSRPRYSASTNGHLNGDDMHPYQNPFQGGNGPPQQQQQQQQRQYPPNQLPPMYPSASMPPPMPPPPGPNIGGPQHQALYPAAPTQPPLPPANTNSAVQTSENGLRSLAGNNGKYRFELRVDQQPQRARMCGFGDKDRRPITPPPCVRLIITDLRTGEPVPHDQVDGTFFVLQVDLWDDSATREVNIVRSSSASPAVSISTATTTSYPPTPDRPFYDNPPVLFTTYDGQQIHGPLPGYGQMMAPRPPMPGYPGYYQPNPYANMPGGPGMAAYPMPGPSAVPQQQNHTMFTRNLIGSLTVNASPLKDPDGYTGYWFVLQDLSVRTEGWFR